jgi:hypothetical protein
MLYKDLNELVYHSSSSRRYFFSLPVSMQLSLSEYGNIIRSAAELRAHAERMEKYNRAVENSEYYNKQTRS